MKIKSAARRMLGPVARPLLWRIRRITGLRAEIDNFNAAWHQHVPALVNAAASVAALAHEQARMKREHEAALSELKARIDELRGGALSSSPGPRILSVDKVQRARASGARVVVGPAPVMDGFVHVEEREKAGVDIVAPLSNLPFAAGEVRELLASHVLGKFTQQELEGQMLPAWTRVISPGGIFRAIVIDAEAMIRARGAGEIDFDQFRQALVGAGSSEGLRNMFTAASLQASLSAAGLVDVRVVAQGRRAEAGYELEVAARVPAK